MKNWIFISFWMVSPIWNNAQTNVFTTFLGEEIEAGKKYRIPNSEDSISFSTIRFYLSDFQIYSNDKLLRLNTNTAILIDPFVGKTMIDFKIRSNKVPTKIAFTFGLDSLLNTSGALKGDLDPSKGMYWTWQSGYINCKLEGTYWNESQKADRFTFHLGGYAQPYLSAQKLELNWTNKSIILSLEAFAELMKRTKKIEIMRPCEDAVALSKLLATQFILK
jgi:hypothetical protein